MPECVAKIPHHYYYLLFFPYVIQSSVIKMLSLYYPCKTIAGNNRLNKVWKKVCTVAALADLKGHWCCLVVESTYCPL